MIRPPPRSTQCRSSAASDVYKRQIPAIEATQVDMGPDVVVDASLRAWCGGEQFRAILTRFVAGERDLVDELVESYLAGDFYLPGEADRRTIGTEVIASFLGHVQSGLLGSSEGHVLLANRME